MTSSRPASQGAPRRLTDLDGITQHLPPGSSVVLQSAYAEPKFLAEELARIGAGLHDVRVYSMMPMGGSPYAAPELGGHLVLRTFYPGKGLREAVNAGRAEIIRAPLSTIPRLFEQGTIKADVLLLQVSPPDSDGRMSMGVAVDYMRAVLDQDPIVVAEVNPAMPHTCGNSCVPIGEVDYVVDARTPPHSVNAVAADEVDKRIAAHVAELVENEAVLQVGIGSIADLVLGHLTHLRDLGIHTGIMTEAAAQLIERGVVTNATKRVFTGKSVTTMAGGTQTFYDYLHRNPLIEFHPCSLTHDAATLAGIDGLCAINTVLQVDLEGRANAEKIDGRTVSCVGGLPDFAKGASKAKGGRSVVSLRATSRDGRQSNILPRLPEGTPVALVAADIDFVVTEYGVARMRGLSRSALALALADIAHPDHRADLRRSRGLQQP